MPQCWNTSNDAVQLDAFAPAIVMLRALRQRHISSAELLDLHH